MALCHLPNPSLLTSRELLLPFLSVSRLVEEHLRWDNQRSHSCRALLFTCSAKKPRVSRKSKATKSNAELCCELREFVFSMGLPEDHVPSTKELLEHGRKDLAYIVRRRGYQEITKLLMKPTNGATTGDKHLSNCSVFDKVSTQIEGQDTQGNMYVPAESLHEAVTSHRQNGELEVKRDTLESEETLSRNAYQFSSNIHNHNAHDADGGSMGSQLSFLLTRGQCSSRNDVSSGEMLGNSNFDENKTSDLADNANQIEINRLKEILHRKETELALLKQQVEEEKLALSIMQHKAQSEISKVQNIILTKEEELLAAEESLSGLREVLIEYWGHGESVEVAGSFNGWQHRVTMNLHTSSKTANPNGTREAVLWSTILWLYPGIYEIKFVVDGHWKIDSQREFITVGSITNNILRVER